MFQRFAKGRQIFYNQYLSFLTLLFFLKFSVKLYYNIEKIRNQCVYLMRLTYLFCNLYTNKIRSERGKNYIDRCKKLNVLLCYISISGGVIFGSSVVSGLNIFMAPGRFLTATFSSFPPNSPSTVHFIGSSVIMVTFEVWKKRT